MELGVSLLHCLYGGCVHVLPLVFTFSNTSEEINYIAFMFMVKCVNSYVHVALQ